MRHERFPAVHPLRCACTRCDPRPSLARRFADAMEPGDLETLAIGAGLGTAAAIVAILWHFRPIIAALFS